MLTGSKILWREGMFLEPHHFQLSERFLAARADARIDSLACGGYRHGFTDLEIDRDALLGGNFSINRAAGVFPDGSCFGIGVNAPSGPFFSAAPTGALSRSFASHCRTDRLTLDVYLALPVGADGIDTVSGIDGINANDSINTDNGAGTRTGNHRYIERTVLVADELSRGNDKEIRVGEPNYLIRFEGEPLDGCVSLRVARLSRTGSGYMELKPGCAPPVLFTRVSDVLRSSVSGLLELLWARIGSLAQRRRQTGSGQAFFSASQENSFRLLSTLCTFTPLLSRLHEIPKIHPFDYYMRLTELCGSLLSFSPSISLDKFPSFDHDNPAESFIALTERIRESLQVEFWTDCTALPLERINSATWLCRFPNEKFAAGVNLFIGVSAKAPQKELLIDVLQRMKAGSRDKLDMLISSSTQGLSLIHAKNIPEGLAAKPDYVYFVVDRQGQYWQGVETSGTLGIHFSGGGYPDMKIEVLALKHQDCSSANYSPPD